MESLRRKVLFWHRHEIENYLLDPRVIVIALSEIKKAPKTPHNVSFPESEADALRLMEQLAQRLLENHAGWHTWETIRSLYNQANVGLRGPSQQQLVPDGSQSSNQLGWITYLKQECQRVQQAYKSLSNFPFFQEDQIENQYLQTLKNLQSKDFFENQRFLSELGGHELLAQFMYHLHANNVKISLEDLQTYLLTALDQLYEPNFFQPDDFNALAQRLI